MDLKFKVPLEGPTVIHSKQLFIFGGRSFEGDSERITKADHPLFDDSGKTFDWQMVQAGKLSRGRAMPKIFHSSERN